MQIAGRSLALPVEHVLETMRPLPIEPVTGAAPSVLGTALIRGEAVPVIDAAHLFARPADPGAGAGARRFVVLRAGASRVALQVDAVVDVRELGDGEPLGALPADTEPGLAAALHDARWIEAP